MDSRSCEAFLSQWPHTESFSHPKMPAGSQAGSSLFPFRPLLFHGRCHWRYQTAATKTLTSWLEMLLWLPGATADRWQWRGSTQRSRKQWLCALWRGKDVLGRLAAGGNKVRLRGKNRSLKMYKQYLVKWTQDLSRWLTGRPSKVNIIRRNIEESRT